jgi:general secretion pathway protein D
MRIPRPVPGATPAPAPAAPAAVLPSSAVGTSKNSFNFPGKEAKWLIRDYASRTGRTLLFTPNPSLDTIIELVSDKDAEFSDEEYLMGIETALNLHGIALEPVGDKFLRVVKWEEMGKFGTKTQFPPEGVDASEDRYPETGKFVSRVIELKHIRVNEAKPVIENFVRAGGQVQELGTDGDKFRVIDSADNVNRILEMIGYLDRPIVAIETNVIREIRFAKATAIKGTLDQIVTALKAEEAASKTSAATERQSGPPGTVTRPLPSGVTLPRAGRPITSPSATGGDGAVPAAQRGMFRGTPKIFADDRAKILIIIAHPDDIVSIDKLVASLDVKTTPDGVVVRVFRLQHALAEDAATLLNEFTAKDSGEEDGQPRVSASKDSPEGEKGAADQPPPSPRPRPKTSSTAGGETTSAVDGLDTSVLKIFPDKRMNALVVKALASNMDDIATLIASIDVEMSQVVIETVLVELNFEDSLETGVDWVQRAMRTVDSSGKPIVMFAGQGGGGSLPPADPLAMTSASSVPSAGAGISYYLTALDLNVDMVVRAVASDSRARIMSSPVIMTQDNKEAVLEATVKRYFFKGKKYAGEANGNPIYEDDVEQQDVGLTLTVTPRINNNGYVVMNIKQTIDAIAGTQTVNGDEWPIVSSRSMVSDIAVNSGDTVILGGLAQNSLTDTKSKIPLLGDIPFLGWFFRTTRQTKSRKEVVVFLTPRVITKPSEGEDEARNRKAYLDTQGVWRSDWSSSRLADPVSEKERKAVLQRGTETLEPPRHVLTRELAPLNERYGLKPEDEPAHAGAGEMEPPTGEEIVEPDVPAAVPEPATPAAPPAEAEIPPAAEVLVQALEAANTVSAETPPAAVAAPVEGAGAPPAVAPGAEEAPETVPAPTGARLVR